MCLLALLKFCECLLKRKGKQMFKFLRKLKDVLYKRLAWNYSIRFLIQQTQPLVLCSLINFYDNDNTIASLVGFSDFISVLGVLYVTQGILVIVYLVKYKYKQIFFFKQCGTLVEGVRHETSLLSRFYVPYLMIKWLLTSMILVILRDHPATQIFVFLIISVISQGYLIYVQPLDTRLENAISLFNELMVSLYLYVLISLTDYNDSLRDQAGIALLYIVLISFFANFVKLLIQTSILFKSRMIPLLKRYLKLYLKSRSKRRVVSMKTIKKTDFESSSKTILQFIQYPTVEIRPVMMISAGDNEGMENTIDMQFKGTILGRRGEGNEMKLEEYDEDTMQNIEQPNNFT
ncbi:hypothetical protein FGO68_gene9418 [Halteria grandinella]|uniref:TRP C-terminal domain-containing protein n=1 Tax=Halteria grandinella TaxID=5974 RepID=A0A8J8TAD2_HALGN|nr:hypothetical protein FGO68_gene9418 [Halteria grandinella]